MDITLGAFYSNEIYTQHNFREFGADFRCLSFGFSTLVMPTLKLTIKSENGGSLNSRSGQSLIAYKIYTRAAKHTALEFGKEIDMPQNLWNFAGGSTSGNIKLYLETQPDGDRGDAPMAGLHSDNITLIWNWAICTVGAMQVCANWSKGVAQTHIHMKIDIEKSCMFSSHGQADVNFGSYPLVEMFKPTRASASIMCTRLLPFNLHASDGDHAMGAWRRMKGPGQAYIEYQLYESGTDRVINAANRISGTGQGYFVQVPFEARMNSHQAAVPLGNYVDHPVLIIEY